MASTEDGGDKQRILSEVPESLKRLVIIVVKTFYGLHHYIVVDYIQRHVIIKEERLRDLLKIDQKALRAILITLKVDKIVKERMVKEEVDGRTRTFIYYFVNYKAVLNVCKYKLHHMHQKLESIEKNDVQKASYKCTGCAKHYDAMDMGKIFDPFTQELKYVIVVIKSTFRCWQCGQHVTQDETSGPTEVTRSSLAKFNEQMAGIFSILRDMDKVQFARHILDPPILATPMEKEDEEKKPKVLQVGEKAFSANAASRSELYKEGITVSIGDQTQKIHEQKEAVPWLQDHSITPEVRTTTTNMFLGDTTFTPFVNTTSSVSLQDYSISEPTTSTVAISETIKTDDISSLLLQEESEHDKTTITVKESHVESAEVAKDEEESEEEEEFVTIQGEKVNIDDVTSEMVGRMTDEEREHYVKLKQQQYAHYY